MRRNILESLKRFEAENAVSSIRFEMEFKKVRSALVEKYGKDAMDRKDRQMEREWIKANK